MLGYLLIAYILYEIGAPTWMFVIAIIAATIKFLEAVGEGR